jgi:serine/threonine protein kinase
MNEVVARIRADQRVQWLRGNRVPIESYLDSHPDLRGQDETTLDLIYSEVRLREELGERADVSDYLARFPQYADGLRRLFEVHEVLSPASASDSHDTSGLPGPNGSADTLPAPREAAPEFPAIPGYAFLERLPAGGPGVVYKARQTDLNLDVALKMIRFEEDAADPRRQALFRREAEAVARLNHPHVVRIYDFGEHQGRPYYTMEYVAGGSLQKRLKAGPLPPREAAALVETLARALHAVHQKGIVHRDLKPGNVLLAGGTHPKIADFGLAKFLDAEKSLTPSEAIVGTVSYMAPEQAAGRGSEVKEPADVYGLGAILYHTLTGRPPFEGDTFLDVLGQVISREPKPLGLGRTYRDLEAVCLKCLEKEPGKRYASAAELSDDLHRFLEGEQTQARPRRWYEKAWRWVRRRPWVGAAAVLCVMAPIVFSLLSPMPDSTARPPDPDRERQRVAELLEEGTPYVFAGSEPLQGPFRLVVGDARSISPNAVEGTFSLETFENCLLELVADPKQDRYRFSVELRHEEAGVNSEIGLFFGLRSHFTGKGALQHGYFALAFADRGNRAWTEKGKDGEPVSRIQTRGYFQKNKYTYGYVVGKEIPFRPTAPDLRPSDWRTIALEVNPAGVTVLWQLEQGRLAVVDRIPAAQLERCLNELRKQFPDMAGISPNYQPRLGLGLYVNRGKASFRRIELRPLAGPE